MGIVIENLTKKYNEQLALDNINLSIKGNTATGLLGPNGAGKTTLMNCITDIIKYDKGEIYVNEKSQKENAFSLKKEIGFLPENNPLYPEMYVKEYLDFVASIFSLPKSRISEVIEMVGLEKESHKKIKQLSKGYKQRVGLAQAIINDPKYLILDEPTNGLDPNQINEIRKLIQNLAKEKTVIISTHILQEVEALCSNIIIINQGKILTHEDLSYYQENYSSLEEAFYHYTQHPA